MKNYFNLNMGKDRKSAQLRRGKKGGTELIFDRNKRVEFVTGFKKRKDERREIAKKMILEEQADIKRQNRQLKYKQKERIEEQYE